jgi:hypothetical protein
MFDRRKVIFEINGLKLQYSRENLQVKIVYSLDKIEAYGHKKLVRF